MSPEVLIYIQTVKNYFIKNKEAREYFLNGVDEELFYKYLGEISQKNFDKEGEVMLNVNQFEFLKKAIKAISIVKDSKEEQLEEKFFVNVKGYGKFSLN